MEHLVSLLLQGGPATALWRSRPLPSVGHRLLLLQAVPHPPIPAADRPFTAGTTVPSLPTTEAVQRRNDEYEKICRCTTEFADCHVKQCQQATSSKGKRRARLTSVVKNNRTSVLKFPAHQYTYFWFSRLVLVQDTS
ncbi:uncharacterized protein [Aegilops tauschii subsp. strangulata]|uniref:uncharacterized protein isoform X4 n=1 Tax=Aegilops tauschii subsp. strangulata TaxID=200361 RepID=UPI001ABCBEA7|nr:uncharacterized protein LOC109763699 isoform X4 [Aegilops tauschii subsp. strangulata]